MLIEYSLVRGETIASSANLSNLRVLQSGPATLLEFKTLIFLDTDSSEIEKGESVWIGVTS